MYALVGLILLGLIIGSLYYAVRFLFTKNELGNRMPIYGKRFLACVVSALVIVAVTVAMS